MEFSYVIIKILIEYCKQVILDINQRIGVFLYFLDLDGEIQVFFADFVFVEEVILRYLEFLIFVFDLFGVVVFLVKDKCQEFQVSWDDFFNKSKIRKKNLDFFVQI